MRCFRPAAAATASVPLLLHVLVAVLVLTVGQCAATDPNFEFRMDLVNNTHVRITMSTLNTQDWISIGWNVDYLMYPADSILCKHDAVPVCTDRHCTEYEECPPDAVQNLEYSYTLVNGNATYVVLRPLNTGDPTDEVVVGTDIQKLMWGVGVGPASEEHYTYGGFDYDITTHTLTVINNPKKFHWMYGVGLAALVIAFVGGALVVRNNWAIRHTRPFPAMPRNAVGADGVAELSVGDMLFLVFFVVFIVLMMVGKYLTYPADGYRAVPGRACGFGATIMMGATLFPVYRLGPLSYLLGISLERTVKYHRWAGRVTWLLTTLHLILMVDGMGASSITDEITGTLAWVCLTLILLTSLEPIRRAMYEAFLYTHFVLFLATIVLAMLHEGLVVVVVGLCLLGYVIDWVPRLIQRSRKPTSVECVPVGPAHCRLTVTMPPGFTWEPGQWVMIHDEHPFTISNAPSVDAPTRAVIIIKRCGPGSFTDKLVTEPADKVAEQVRVAGPYGCLSVPITSQQYSTVYLVSGGVGVTPMAALLDAIVTYPNTHSHIKTVLFVWTCRDADLAAEMCELLRRADAATTVKVHLAVHLSTATEPTVIGNVSFAPGRPALQNLLAGCPPPSASTSPANSSGSSASDAAATAMYVCGPDALVVDAVNSGRALPFPVHIHTESFYF
eukprot:PhM_4_TR8392/c0_g2_i2/m.62608/K00521/E1.16.1.7; ferric-chelate reductase